MGFGTVGSVPNLWESAPGHHRFGRDRIEFGGSVGPTAPVSWVLKEAAGRRPSHLRKFALSVLGMVSGKSLAVRRGEAPCSSESSLPLRQDRLHTRIFRSGDAACPPGPAET